MDGVTSSGWCGSCWWPWLASAQTGADTLDLPLPHGEDVPGPVEVQAA